MLLDESPSEQPEPGRSPEQTIARIAFVGAVVVVQALAFFALMFVVPSSLSNKLDEFIWTEFAAVVTGGIAMFGASYKMHPLASSRLVVLAWATAAFVSPLIPYVGILSWAVLLVSSPIILSAIWSWIE